MRFPDLRTNILHMSQDEALFFIASYQTARTKEISSTLSLAKPKKTDKSSNGKQKSIKVTPEQLTLLRKMGLI